MGPTALQSSIGWILSGPCPHNNTEHTYITTLFTNSTLDEQLHKFWDLESMGIVDTSIYDDLVENIVFENGRYQVELPWKQPHSFLQDNYKLSLKRLRNLRQRLLSDPKLYSEYDSIIQEQKIQGIIEPIDISTPNDGTVHYLPHHAVLRNDKSTTKVRIVFDASAKVNQNASLNDCLYVGQSLNQKILDIILRFRTYPIALTGDIEKAFLMITLPEKDRDVLRFLWFDDFSKPDPQIVCYRFTRVVFGVCSSPFLLNAILKYHAEKYIQDNPEFVKTFLRSIYVDDFTSGAQSEDEAFELYKSAKSKLLDGGFNLRKFKTNSSTLQTKIDECESNRNNSEQVDKSIQEDDESYAKLMVGSQSESSENLKILGVEWNPSTDEFVYNLEGISQLANSVLPTKRNVVSISAKFCDPLGFLQPLIVMFKILFRELCRANLEWDDL
ncbi:hypothetical protein SNE40_009523 [Patella caerulea]|uniref:Reverse transcriptase domain-containing protein n=1 Tax=Patella caerulea TaxID=87958 RepID=A0AAN8JPU1_PATCE